VYRMTGNRPKVRHGFPSEHDFKICFELAIELTSALDRARQQVESTVVAETLFHIRGFIHDEMARVKDYVRPRE
jgi:hypothetical protein